MQIVNTKIDSHNLSISTASLRIKEYFVTTNTLHIQQEYFTETSPIVIATNTTVTKTIPELVRVIE